MKKEILILILFISIILGISFVISLNEKISSDVYEGLENNDSVQVIVKLKDTSAQTLSILNDSNISESEKYKNYVQTEISYSELDRLNKNSKVEKIEIVPQISALLQNSVPLINASLVWPIQISGINITGSNETVCIIDTGVNFTHSDLTGRNKSCVIDCYNKACVENCSIADDNGHGTHVAGIVGALGGIKGVGINISMIGIKVLNSAGQGSATAALDLSRSIDYCVSQNVSVISMSLGTSSPDLYSSDCSSSYSSWTSSIAAAAAKNISVIAASGNDGNSSSISSPACIGNVTAVGGTDKSDNIGSYSNRNSITDLFATGGSSTGIGSCTADSTDANRVCSTSKTGNYESRTGTSMATPHISAAFALIRQFFVLQSNRILTPNEIQNILNSTGKQIYDSSSGLYFSRINIYSALLSLDNSLNVSLISPADNIINSTTNQTFSCNSTDNIKVKNLTLQVWNYLGNLYYNYTNDTSGVLIRIDKTINDIPKGNYKWNCLAYNENNTFSHSSSNFSIFIGNLSVSLISPASVSYTRNSNMNFSFSSQTADLFRLKNYTLMLWNSSSNLVYNSTQTISGTYNSTNASYSFSLEGNYSWNFKIYNNNSEFVFNDVNYSIIYDVTAPAVNSISPADSSAYTSNSQSITFTYNLSDNINIANCSLMINDAFRLSNSSITNLSMDQSFTYSFTPGTYNWKINCSDSAGNFGNSSSRSFVVSASVEQISSSSGGGGGGATDTSKTYNISITQISHGYTQELSKSDKIKFTFYDKNAGEHTLTVNEVKENSVNITIRSNAVNILLGIGQSVKLNLSSPNFYDIYIKLNSIENKKAKLTIQLINEAIEKPGITGKVSETNETTQIKTEELTSNIDFLNFELKKMKIIVYSLVIVTIIITLFIIFLKRKNIKDSVVKEYREKFDKHVKPKKNK